MRPELEMIGGSRRSVPGFGSQVCSADEVHYLSFQAVSTFQLYMQNIEAEWLGYKGEEGRVYVWQRHCHGSCPQERSNIPGGVLV